MNKLKQFRQMRSLKQQEFADLLGVTQGSVSKSERSKTRLNIVILKRMVKVFDLSAKELFEFVRGWK